MVKNPRIDRQWREPLKRSEVATGFGITLGLFQRDFFATWTYVGDAQKTQIAYGPAFCGLQELAKVCGVPYKRLLIALRGEEGESTGRFHFHCLVGGTATRNYHTTQDQAEWLGKVRVDVRQYYRLLTGAEYVSKCLRANAYELIKYSFANAATLSASVIRLIAGIDASGDRRCGQDTRKNGGVMSASSSVRVGVSKQT
jgi:hypothetical protein